MFFAISLLKGDCNGTWAVSWKRETRPDWALPVLSAGTSTNQDWQPCAVLGGLPWQCPEKEGFGGVIAGAY